MRFWRKLLGKSEPPNNNEKGEKRVAVPGSERDKQKRTAASDTPLTYKQLLTVAQNDPRQADFETLRLTYAQENPYNPDARLARNERLEGILADSVQMVQQGSLIQAQQTIGRALQENYLYIKAHMAAAVIHDALGDEAQLAYHQAWVQGLLDSILSSGDGRSHETAFVVIDISEEYDVLRRLGVQPGWQRLSFYEGGLYDVLTVITPQTGDSSELYFRLEWGCQPQAPTPPDAPPAIPAVATANLGGERWAQLEDALQRVVDEAAAGNTDFCVTVASKTDPSAWFQITWDSLNFAYPMTTEPLATITGMYIGLPDEALLLGYEPGSYATLENESRDSSMLADFIGHYFQAVFQITLNDKTATIEAENL
jgi:hypothetical protein